MLVGRRLVLQTSQTESSVTEERDVKRLLSPRYRHAEEAQVSAYAMSGTASEYAATVSPVLIQTKLLLGVPY